MVARHSQEGFTFAELMIVVLILGILAGIGVPAYWRFAERAARKATVSTLKNVQQQVNLYKADVGKFPDKLDNLVTKPAGADAKRWEGPYLEKLPRDGWNNELVYKKVTGGKHPYQLFSYGKGGPESGSDEDEISVWDE